MEHPMPQAWRRFTLQALALYTVLTIAATFPQAPRFADHVADVGDPLLNTWALAWVAHQLPFAPARLFDANIFHPERHTLAYSETLVAPALLGAPLLWLGAGPVAVYNILFLLAFVLTGTGTALLVLSLTNMRGAALVSGAIFAFLPYRFDHYAHFQLLQTQWIPLSLFFLHRLVAHPTRRDAALLGASVGAQALTSMYNTLFLVFFIGAVSVVLIGARRPSRRLVAGIGCAAIVAAALSWPAASAHLAARAVVGERSRAEAESGGAAWTDYLASVPHSRLHGGWSAKFGGPERRLFPGFAALALGLVALWPPMSRAKLAYVVAAVLCVEMSRGFNGLLYPLLYDLALPLRSLRVPARMGLLAGFALAVLAGFGWARLSARLPRRWSPVATAVALVAVMTDSWAAPLSLTRVPVDAPAVYFDMLRDKGATPRATVARLPWDPSPSVLLDLPIHRDAPTYMYYSTFHWQTLVNGYS